MNEQNVRTSFNEDSGSTMRLAGRSVLRRVWQTRLYVLFATAVAVLPLLGFVLLSRVAIPAVQVHQIAARLNFPGVEAGEYPNGRRFGIRDIIAPVVLGKVYDKLKLKQYGLSFDDFATATSVSPYLSTFDYVLERYRDKLSNRRLTAAETKEIEDQLQSELAARQHSVILVRVALQGSLGVPEPVAENLPVEIINTWASYSIDQLGVLNLPTAVAERPIVDMARVRALDPLVAVEYITSRISSFESVAVRIDAISGARHVVDEKSSHSIGSIRRELVNMQQYELTSIISSITDGGLWRDSRQLIEFLQLQLYNLKSARQVEVDKAATARRAFDDYTRGMQPAPSVPSTPGGSPTAGGAPVPAPGSNTNYQISDSLLDRIMQLSAKYSESAAERGFRQKLLNEVLESERQAIANDDRIRRVEAAIAAVKASSAETTSSSPDKAKALEQIQARLVDFGQRVNELWAVMHVLYDRLSVERVGYSEQLYSQIPISSSERSYTVHPIWDARLLVIVAAALFGILLLMTGLSFVIAMLRAEFER